MNVLISAGEVSGDVVGARLAREIHRRGDARIWGLGGPRMAAENVELVATTIQLGRVGVSESFSAIAPFWRAFANVRAEVKRELPDVALLVANDIFNVIAGRWLRARGIPTLAVFPPQVWIWKAVSRVFSRSYDAIAASFADEREVWGRHKPTHFVGHYLADELRTATDEERRAARAAMAPDAHGRLIALLPGSRPHEIATLLPLLLDTAAQLSASDPSLRFVMALADATDDGEVACAIDHRGLADVVRTSRDSHAVMRASDLLLIASGTATLEAALIGTPMVILYRVQPMTIAIVRLAIRLGLVDSERLGLPNLILDRDVVPELSQETLSVANAVGAARRLLDDASAMRAMRDELANVRARVDGRGSIARIVDLAESLARREVVAPRELALEGDAA